MTQKTRTRLERVRNVVETASAIMVLIAGGAAFAWSHFAVPDIEARICKRTDPLLKAMELQNYLIMESMPDSLVQRAIDKYTRMEAAMKGVGQ